MINPIIKIAHLVANNFTKHLSLENTYNNELALEALLLLQQNHSFRPYLKTINHYITLHSLKHDTIRNWKNQQFHDISYPWFNYNKELQQYSNSYIKCTDNWIKETRRLEDSTIIHNCTHSPTGSLIDMLQAYMIRLSRTASLTGNSTYAIEALNQIKLYRRNLQDDLSGCYHQGQGWLKNDEISPGCWSRGQGWVLHGMIWSLPHLKTWNNLYLELKKYLLELVDNIIPYQAESGSWHQLIDRPSESFPDSSGTALILEAIITGQEHGLFHETKYLDASNNGWNWLIQQVDNNGVIDQACKGPGTIWEIEPWKNSIAPNGDPHGVFSVLFACAAKIK